MALNRSPQRVSYPAAADLSASQFRILAHDSAGRVAVASGSADNLAGVLMNKPGTIDSAADVCIGGVVKLVAGAAVTAGSAVMAGTLGKAFMTATQGNAIVGRAASAAAGDGELFECQVDVGIL